MSQSKEAVKAQAHVASAEQETLLSLLRQTRKRLGLSQEEVALRAGMARMSVTRLEAPEAEVQLSTFLSAAKALGLKVQLVPESEPAFVPPAKLSHRGLFHNRTRLQHNQREALFARAWEQENAERAHFGEPRVEQLLPGCTQEQATAAATVIQWLGSQVGFNFLQEVLKAAGDKLTPAEQLRR